MSESATPITASMLYDLVTCPHRVTMDVFADPRERDDVSPFVQLLWDLGQAHELAVMADLDVPYLDLSVYEEGEKEALTLAAMERGEPLIYSGRISAGGLLLGIPDLLRKEAGGYVAGDIKSGAGEEGGGDEEEGKPKKSYAVQLGLYTDVLERLGKSAGRRAFVWDVYRSEVTYDFGEAYGKRNPRKLWQDYEECLAEARAIVSRAVETLPAYGAICKNCVWYSARLKNLEASNDLTLIFDLGRSKRNVMVDRIATLRDLAKINLEGFFTDKGKKTIFPRVGRDTLRKFQARAALAALAVQKDGKPYLTAPVSLPASARELFFDIEVDPMRDVCYLHGFVERNGGDIGGEQFIAFFADQPTAAAEEKAFADAWGFIRSRQPCAIYYYSKYERTWYRNLQKRYPHICSADEIEALFADRATVDLYYDVVREATEWPTRDFSIKTLAKHLGFKWRDTHPSGAASIEWFDCWVQTGDPEIRQRILDYNEDDCRATRVLLDGIRDMATLEQ
ncbi:MAG: TM0106 family RecB-like putative nuclease [Methylocella sp.]